MFYAALWNRLRTVETLDQLGYDVHSIRCDKYNTTPLVHAAHLNREVSLCVRALLVHCSDIAAFYMTDGCICVLEGSSLSWR
jgi:hypothetical protein